MDTLHFELGRLLRETRMERGMTQSQIAERIGKGRTTIVNMEAGRLRLSVQLLVRVAEVLDVDPSDLLKSAVGDRRQMVPDYLEGLPVASRTAVLEAIEEIGA